jgi:predicted nucleic acid-binding protein
MAPGFNGMILLDTNILIEVFKGNKDIIKTVYSAGPENLSLSSISAMELYYGALNKLELQRIRKYLCAFQIVHISNAISETATQFIERYAKSHNLQIPDALIAATSVVTQRELLTLNAKDFKFIHGLSLKGFASHS